MTTQNEAAERTPHIFADDSIDADGAYCTRHEHWVSRNETAERLHVHDWTVARGPGWNSPYCATCHQTLAEHDAAERRATVERIRERAFDLTQPPSYQPRRWAPDEITLRAILDEEAAR